ncbi:hypothetical protein QA648_22090 (plasmid) [Rhizobium sp. CB3171]|uniref:hypothetical protein n=1 Tax=Rhizobium sp. CB3171 TaxID=3039157 RepID=UPI0024B047C6|nr:hypothetical protein [Rhizobium sp. CB3171]WFU05854.1 hypothetical protein QA648_22090 [Rhizobium sp. CB3171]
MLEIVFATALAAVSISGKGRSHLQVEVACKSCQEIGICLANVLCNSMSAEVLERNESVTRDIFNVAGRTSFGRLRQRLIDSFLIDRADASEADASPPDSQNPPDAIAAW